MIETPLLLFPKFYPDKRKRKKSSFGTSHFHKPDFKRQDDRLTPMFETMLQAFISTSAEGFAPEYTLVFEIAGNVEEFIRAVNAIKGLEWQGEFDIDIPPTEDFYSDYLRIGKRFFYDKKNDITIPLAEEMSSLLESNHLLKVIGQVHYMDISKIPDAIHVLSKKYPKLRHIIEIKLKQSENQVKTKFITGRYFLGVSNKAALQKILNLWNTITSGKQLERGYTTWEKILRNMVRIRFWNETDRIRETNVINYFKEELEIHRESRKQIIFDLELWYNPNPEKRRQIEESVNQLISSENGKILNTCLITEIRFHALKMSLPYQNIEKILLLDFPGIFYHNDIKFIRPAGQSVGHLLEGEPLSKPEEKEIPLPDDRIIAACLDGYPLPNHSLLSGRISIDDPDDFLSSYQAKEMIHGTGIVSLICHGDLEAKEQSIRSTIYFRPIMKPDTADFRNEIRTECISREVFFEDLIERSVRRIFEGEGDVPPVAPNVKIINLSICDCYKSFLGQMSSVARLIDWLSFKYNVLFIISAGNIYDSFQLNTEDNNSLELDLTNTVFNRIIENRRNRKLFSPAESINSISVSSLHTDALDDYHLPGYLYNIQNNQLLPAPYSTIGYGYRNAIKPDVIIPGGRQLYLKISNNTYKPFLSVKPPGQRVAATGPEGDINRQIFTRGTSNSCALCTKKAIEIYDMLYELTTDHGYSLPDENIAVLMKALLIHSSSWGDSVHLLRKILIQNEIPSALVKKEISRFLGYGTPHINRVIACTQNRVTAIGIGSILKDQRHEYRFPLPPSFSG